MAKQNRVRLNPDGFQVPLRPEEQRALEDWVNDFRDALPQLYEVTATARRIYEELLKAPQWQIVDTPKPEWAAEPDMWSVGHAQVNYVDSIEPIVSERDSQQ